MCCLFQCGFPFIRKGDELLHIFSHHISKTEDELREILRSFMLGHLVWLHQISEIVLSEVNVLHWRLHRYNYNAWCPFGFCSNCLHCVVHTTSTLPSIHRKDCGPQVENDQLRTVSLAFCFTALLISRNWSQKAQLKTTLLGWKNVAAKASSRHIIH